MKQKIWTSFRFVQIELWCWFCCSERFWTWTVTQHEADTGLRSVAPRREEDTPGSDPNSTQSSRRGMKNSRKLNEMKFKEMKWNVKRRTVASCFTLRTKRESGRDVKQLRDPHETAGRRLSRVKTTEEEKQKVMNANRRRETARFTSDQI